MRRAGQISSSRHHPPPGTQAAGLLRALQLIETVPEGGPWTITVVVQRSGSALSPEEAMGARVEWANRVRYQVVTRDVPKQFAPYNAVIRVLGTEDYRADYLAILFDEGQADDQID